MYPIWYLNTLVALILQVLLFWRAARSGSWRAYPLFYTYLIYTSLWSLICALPAVVHHPAYVTIYWSSYLLAAMLRFGIAADVHRHMFPRDSALRERASIIVLFSLALLAVFFWTSHVSPAASPVLDSARKLALSIAVWILVLLSLAQYYGVRIGRNIWGMALGLLTFMGSEFVHLAAMDLAPRFRGVFGNIQPVAFVFMLAVWTYALWDFYPNPRTTLDHSLARRFLSAWEDRWAELPQALRKVVKP
jgi:hypothetical protein